MIELDQKVASMEQDRATGRPVKAFPSVHAVHKEVIPSSTGMVGKLVGANYDGPGLGKLAQHQIDNVTYGLEKNSEEDRKILSYFMESCG